MALPHLTQPYCRTLHSKIAIRDTATFGTAKLPYVTLSNFHTLNFQIQHCQTTVMALPILAQSNCLTCHCKYSGGIYDTAKIGTTKLLYVALPNLISTAKLPEVSLPNFRTWHYLIGHSQTTVHGAVKVPDVALPNLALPNYRYGTAKLGTIKLPHVSLPNFCTYGTAKFGTAKLP
jgi:hypothetical protein